MPPLGAAAVHVGIDMQRIFAEATEWRVATLLTIVDPILRVARAHPAETIFTRFITPHRLEEASGAWRRYYERWSSVLQGRMDPALLDLVEPLLALVPPAEVCDKTTFSAFHSKEFLASLERRRTDTLVLTGAETDVCVLGTAFDAVDRGYRVIVVADAVTSLSPDGHRATLDAVFARLDQQIEVATVEDVLAAWPRG